IIAATCTAGQVKSALSVPHRDGHRALAPLTAASLRPRAFTPEQTQLLQLLASEIAPTLEAGRLFNQVERERLEAEALAEAGKLIAAGTVARDALGAILVALQRIAAVESAALVVPDGEG